MTILEKEFVCQDCLCHMPQSLKEKHTCPQWLKALVKIHKQKSKWKIQTKK